MSDNNYSATRRQVLLGAGAVAAAAASSSVLGATNHHEHHGNHGGANQSMVDASLKCIGTGQACINHCLMEFSRGNKDMAGCAKAAQEMLSLCAAFSNMAALESRHLKKTAQACIDVCDTCAAECEKHAKKHEVCKNCMDACRDCIKEMKKVS